jgi:predicted nuclease with TOPRIM domain
VDIQAFDVLEQKVSQILEKLNRMRAENENLQTSVREWEDRFKEVAAKLEDVTRQRDQLAENQRDSAKEERIRQKVVELLARLEAA